MKTVIPIGPYHPLQEEPELFYLTLDGETVVDVDVRLGYNHRGIEKIAESKTWDQITFLIERICGICSTSHPIAYCNAVEDCAGIEIPERAKYIRSIIGELERIHSHLLWLGLAGHFLGYNTLFMWAWKWREPVLDLFEQTTGNRNHYAMIKIGGARRDIKNEDIPAIRKCVDSLVAPLEMITKAAIDDPVLHARLKGVGVLKKEDAIKYCVVGPTARASGVAIDVRKDEPHAAYDMVEWNVITQESGDVFAKAVVRLLEMFESIKIIQQCLDGLEKTKGAEFCVEVENIPPGDGIGRYEAPRGETYHYVRSDGTNCPVRHKIRAPTYVNLPSFKASCIGQTISDVAITLASIDPCYCCTERTAIIDSKNGKKEHLGEKELIRLSQEKTQKIRKKLGNQEGQSPFFLEK
ncbi:NADH:ubiquinone oxidoreductase [Candidatus Desantisbacteria bacterium CG1_02_38_46]|uniref:NADH:ubiquinone oxidoreductase n=1 Tax=Candidatus Desantisbacteria bacterium CG1_02_38_46 TaxID=1817893 RepID=A0A1J4SBW7_9BACT|nr:MAG: NADH:ubiquinone oxidoreductase [Candidatus Desantisbacteria bacterium CG1_02_38_46]